MGGQQDRPRAMIAGPHEKVYIGSYPDYGLLVGRSVSTTQRELRKGSIATLFRNQSMASLAYLHSVDLIAAGVLCGRNGTHATEKESQADLVGSPRGRRRCLRPFPVLGPEPLSLWRRHRKVFFTESRMLGEFYLRPGKEEMKRSSTLGFRIREIFLSHSVRTECPLWLAKDAIFIIDPKPTRFPFCQTTDVHRFGHGPSGHKIYYGSGADLWEFESREILRLTV